MQCFMKDNSSGGCFRSIGECATEGPAVLGVAWACEHVGKTKLVSPGGAGAWPEEDCFESRSCRLEGYQCFAQKDGVAVCKTRCEAGQDGWSCERLGGYEPTAEVAKQVGEPAMTSLYCFTAANQDDPFLAKQRELQQGIYTCDGFEVVGPVDEDSHLDLYQAWARIVEIGKYAAFDWIVHVDADTVLIPGRLREGLGRAFAPRDVAAFYADDQGRIPQSLAVLSKKALEIYIRDHDACVRHEDKMHVDGAVGDQAFMRSCLHALGAQFVRIKTTGAVGEPGECKKSDFLAYHSLPSPEEWMDCDKWARLEDQDEATLEAIATMERDQKSMHGQRVMYRS